MRSAIDIFDSLFDAGLWLDFLSHRLFVSLFRLFFFSFSQPLLLNECLSSVYRTRLTFCQTARVAEEEGHWFFTPGVHWSRLALLYEAQAEEDFFLNKGTTGVPRIGQSDVALFKSHCANLFWGPVVLKSRLSYAAFGSSGSRWMAYSFLYSFTLRKNPKNIVNFFLFVAVW